MDRWSLVSSPTTWDPSALRAKAVTEGIFSGINPVTDPWGAVQAAMTYFNRRFPFLGRNSDTAYDAEYQARDIWVAADSDGAARGSRTAVDNKQTTYPTSNKYLVKIWAGGLVNLALTHTGQIIGWGS